MRDPPLFASPADLAAVSRVARDLTALARSGQAVHVATAVVVALVIGAVVLGAWQSSSPPSAPSRR